MNHQDIDLSRINYLAVIAAAVAAIAIGFVWYSPALFGPVWLKLAGISPEAARAGMVKAYASGFVVALVAAFCLALVLDWIKAGSWACGVAIAVVVWLGFVATTRAYGVVFAGQPTGLFFLNSGHELVSYAAMGAILGGWRKRA